MYAAGISATSGSTMTVPEPADVCAWAATTVAAAMTDNAREIIRRACIGTFSKDGSRYRATSTGKIPGQRGNAGIVPGTGSGRDREPGSASLHAPSNRRQG